LKSKANWHYQKPFKQTLTSQGEKGEGRRRVNIVGGKNAINFFKYQKASITPFT